MRTGTLTSIRSYWGRLLILAAAGVLAGHRLAYWTTPHTHVAGVAAHHGTDYLPYLAAVLLPLAAVVLARLAWLEHRHRQRLVSFRALTALQIGMFLLQELVERAALGANVADLLQERVLWVGVGAQLLVAGFVLGIARATPHAIPRLLSLASRLHPATRLAQGFVSDRPAAKPALFSPVTRRGPPVWSH